MWAHCANEKTYENLFGPLCVCESDANWFHSNIFLDLTVMWAWSSGLLMKDNFISKQTCEI